MLRRRLLTRVGLLVFAFVAGAVVAIWLLQDVLARVDRTNADAALLIGQVQTLGMGISQIEAAKYGRSGTPEERAAALHTGERSVREAVELIGAHAVARPGGEAADVYARVREHAAKYASGPVTTEGGETDTAALAESMDINASVQELARVLRGYVAAQQANVGWRFRVLVLALTLAALLMVNVAVVVLLRTAQMVLRPVGALVQGSRELAMERFDHRVQIAEGDEFGELAVAYNRLAAQLQANEERKTETLRQLAVTLNHELNNAMSIIALQLGILDREAGGAPGVEKRLREIRSSLARMAETVASLKQIRRVVLTDYAPGQKMVDLERSVAESEQEGAVEAEHPRPGP